jgi:hypothetical protein
MWRKTGVGSYDEWRESFGESLPGSGDSASSIRSNVPEPSTMRLIALVLRRRNRR